jgi:hypothetical protein
MANPHNKRGSRSSIPHQSKLGRSDRYPSDYGIRDKENASQQPGDKGQGREGLSKGHGASSGKAATGTERERSRTARHK